MFRRLALLCCCCASAPVRVCQQTRQQQQLLVTDSQQGVCAKPATKANAEVLLSPCRASYRGGRGTHVAAALLALMCPETLR